jgi:hypothetical protein
VSPGKSSPSQCSDATSKCPSPTVPKSSTSLRLLFDSGGIRLTSWKKLFVTSLLGTVSVLCLRLELKAHFKLLFYLSRTTFHIFMNVKLYVCIYIYIYIFQILVLQFLSFFKILLVTFTSWKGVSTKVKGRLFRKWREYFTEQTISNCLLRTSYMSKCCTLSSRSPSALYSRHLQVNRHHWSWSCVSLWEFHIGLSILWTSSPFCSSP